MPLISIVIAALFYVSSGAMGSSVPPVTYSDFRSESACGDQLDNSAVKSVIVANLGKPFGIKGINIPVEQAEQYALIGRYPNDVYLAARVVSDEEFYYQLFDRAGHSSEMLPSLPWPDRAGKHFVYVYSDEVSDGLVVMSYDPDQGFKTVKTAFEGQNPCDPYWTKDGRLSVQLRSGNDQSDKRKTVIYKAF